MTSFLINAAKYYAAQPHQDRAWEALWASLDDPTKTAFIKAYRATPEPPKAKELFASAVMEQLTGYGAQWFDQAFCDDANRLFTETGFDQPKYAAMLMANMMHETANFKFMKEIASGWAYEYRSDLGNTKPGDGPRFKGAGVLQLTGRYNYSRLAKALGDPRVMEGVDYVCNTYPFTSAKTWIEENKLLDVAKNQGFDAVCRRINGGTNGLTDRWNKYEICKRVLG